MSMGKYSFKKALLKAAGTAVDVVAGLLTVGATDFEGLSAAAITVLTAGVVCLARSVLMLLGEKVAARRKLLDKKEQD